MQLYLLVSAFLTAYMVSLKIRAHEGGSGWILHNVRCRLGKEALSDRLEWSVKCRVTNSECRCRALILGWISVSDRENGPVSGVRKKPLSWALKFGAKEGHHHSFLWQSELFKLHWPLCTYTTNPTKYFQSTLLVFAQKGMSNYKVSHQKVLTK